jgi:two-component system phosphate regulon response regulator OmpR
MGLKAVARTLVQMDHIVVYEDNDLMRALLKEWLGEAGYRVSAPAPTGALPELPADLVIVSVYMPKHVGARMIREIRAAHPGAAVIAISAQFRSGLCEMGATARALGVEQVMAKPLSRTDLLDSVRAMMSRPSRTGS